MPFPTAATKPLATVSKGRLYAVDFKNGAPTIVGVAGHHADAAGKSGLTTAAGARWGAISIRFFRLPTEAEQVAYDAAVNGALAALPKLAKGDVVEFTHKGQVERGVVATGKLLAGNRIAVDQNDKFRSWKLPASDVRVVKVEEGDAGLLAGYGVTGYKEAKFMSEETVCFNATITHNGRGIAMVQNEGHGGETSCHALYAFGKNGSASKEVLAAANDAVRTFEGLLQQAAKAAGLDTQHLQMADDFVEWYQGGRKMGISLHDTFVATAKKWAEWSKAVPTHSGDDIAKV